MSKVIILFVILLASNILSAGYIGNTNAEVCKIATPIIDNIISGIKNKNYTKYSKNFSKAMKDAIPKEKFPVELKKINLTLGNYISRKFLGFLSINNMTVVLWKAHFDKTENDVLIKLVLSEQNKKYIVMGLFFQ